MLKYKCTNNSQTILTNMSIEQGGRSNKSREGRKRNQAERAQTPQAAESSSPEIQEVHIKINETQKQIDLLHAQRQLEAKKLEYQEELNKPQKEADEKEAIIRAEKQKKEAARQADLKIRITQSTYAALITGPDLHTDTTHKYLKKNWFGQAFEAAERKFQRLREATFGSVFTAKETYEHRISRDHSMVATYEARFTDISRSYIQAFEAMTGLNYEQGKDYTDEELNETFDKEGLDPKMQKAYKSIQDPQTLLKKIQKVESVLEQIQNSGKVSKKVVNDKTLKVEQKTIRESLMDMTGQKNFRAATQLDAKLFSQDLYRLLAVCEIELLNLINYEKSQTVANLATTISAVVNLNTNRPEPITNPDLQTSELNQSNTIPNNPNPIRNPDNGLMEVNQLIEIQFTRHFAKFNECIIQNVKIDDDNDDIEFDVIEGETGELEKVNITPSQISQQEYTFIRNKAAILNTKNIEFKIVNGLLVPIVLNSTPKPAGEISPTITPPQTELTSNTTQIQTASYQVISEAPIITPFTFEKPDPINNSIENEKLAEAKSSILLNPNTLVVKNIKINNINEIADKYFEGLQPLAINNIRFSNKTGILYELDMFQKDSLTPIKKEILQSDVTNLDWSDRVLWEQMMKKTYNGAIVNIKNNQVTYDDKINFEEIENQKTTPRLEPVISPVAEVNIESSSIEQSINQTNYNFSEFTSPKELVEKLKAEYPSFELTVFNESNNTIMGYIDNEGRKEQVGLNISASNTKNFKALNQYRRFKINNENYNDNTIVSDKIDLNNIQNLFDELPDFVEKQEIYNSNAQTLISLKLLFDFEPMIKTQFIRSFDNSKDDNEFNFKYLNKEKTSIALQAKDMKTDEISNHTSFKVNGLNPKLIPIIDKLINNKIMFKKINNIIIPIQADGSPYQEIKKL
jgi:hypothetical protein